MISLLLPVYYFFIAANILLGLFLCWRSLVRGGPDFFLWFSLLNFFLVLSIFDPFLGNVQSHIYAVSYSLTDAILVESQAYVFVVLIFFVFCELFLWGDGGDNFSHVDSNLVVGKDKKFLFLIMALSFLIIYAVLLKIQKYGFSFFVGLDFVQRREQGFFFGFAFSYLLISMSGLVFVFYKNKNHFGLSYLIVIYFLSFFVVGGSRQPLVAVVLPFVFMFLFGFKNKFAAVVLVCCAFPLALEVLKFFLYLRNLSGFDQRIDAISSFFSIINSSDYSASEESSLRFAYYYFVGAHDQYPLFQDFLYFKRMLFFWLPSSVDYFSIKPHDFEYEMFSAYMKGREGTMHPTMFGSFYADAGWLFLPWAALIAFLVGFGRKFLRGISGPRYFLVFSAFSFFFMMVARGAIYGPFVVLLFCLVTYFVLDNISNVKVRL
ncbi:hypothetical protein [Alcanivorax sp.]|uniref:hypothetical protein n=1 Tax=Alcanivorax sp. TaxID=1872427 RepID=UPI0025BE0BD6|nr:hypothetical protein [Alcanivorax sp.]